MINDKEETTTPQVTMHATPELHTSLTDDEEDDTSLADPDADITAEELKLLDEANVEKDDDIEQARATLDNTDDDGEALNESVDETGGDLDVPGAELDDTDEETGDEDEENNSYSHDKQDNN